MPNQHTTSTLPPGQRAGSAFPRFGAAVVPPPEIPDDSRLRISGAVDEPTDIGIDELKSLPRREQVSDFHCVTTWTKQGLHWSGWRLADLYQQVIVPRCRPRPEARWLVLFGLDGYRCSLLLEDALADDVLVVDTLDGEPLSPLHGAPLRVVTPRQYGYKNLKHLCGLGLRGEPARQPFGLEHPRGRVAAQERNAHLPAWLVRRPYRALVGPTAYRLRRGVRLSHYAGKSTLLDELMPRDEHYEVHDVWLDASPEEAYRALAETTGREVRLLAPLMALRMLPALLARRAATGRRVADRTVFDRLEHGGFVRLAEDPGREIVFGVVGRFWKLTGNTPIKSVGDREGFAAFAEPGYAKAVMSFLVRAEGRGSRLVTETRIQTTDPAAARSFSRYWRLVRPGSGLIRRSWLAAVARRIAT